MSACPYCDHVHQTAFEVQRCELAWLAGWELNQASFISLAVPCAFCGVKIVSQGSLHFELSSGIFHKPRCFAWPGQVTVPAGPSVTIDDVVEAHNWFLTHGDVRLADL